MTRKDYATIADALASTRPESYSWLFDHWCETRNAIADALGADNPRFQRGKFLIATEA